MRIHFLLTQDLESPGGLGRYFPLALGLRRLGHHVDISALHADFASVTNQHFQIDGVAVHYVGPMHVRKIGNMKHYYGPAQLAWIAAKGTMALTHSALTIPADIVHVGKPHPMNSVAGMVTATLDRAKLVVDCDDYEAESNHFAKGLSGGWQRLGVVAFEKWTPRRAALVTTNTQFTRQKLLASGVDSARIVYLPNGVDAQRFAIDAQSETALAALRQRWGTARRPVVVYVGSMSLANHPVDLLLQAFLQVLGELPNALLLMVGGGQDYDRLVALAEELGLGESVRFTGRVAAADIPNYYRLGHDTVDPVHDDDVARGRAPLKLVESWAAGVPFVTADVGDRRFLLGNPPAGVLVEPGNPAALAQGLVQILTDSILAQTLAQLGSERVQAYFWDHLAAELAQSYNQLTREKS